MQQTVSKQQPGQNNNSQVQTMIITAITLFALSGLIVGLAVGAYTRPQIVPTAQNIPKNTTPPPPAIHTTPTPIPTATIIPAQPIGCPELNTTAQAVNGIVTYKTTVQAKDRSSGSACGVTPNKNLAAPNITCRIWLVSTLPNDKTLVFPKDMDKLKNADLSTPLTLTEKDTNKEYPEVAGLQFAANTSQAQKCNEQGLGTWEYTLSASVPPGDYELFALTDWQGFYNWYWRDFKVTAQK